MLFKIGRHQRLNVIKYSQSIVEEISHMEMIGCIQKKSGIEDPISR